MIVHVLTLFPRMLEGFLEESIVAGARDKGLLTVNLIDFRDYATDRHHTVDDRPFGGGPGMVLKPEPVFSAVEDVERRANRSIPKILLTPQGRRFDQRKAEALSRCDEFLILAGRYEGFDERIRLGFDWDEVSLGDFVLSGGEIPAMAIIEASMRLIPGALGHPESAERDSFSSGILDHPHYTRPRVFRDWEVPEILLSGDHAKIEVWRHEQAMALTRERRGDLLADPNS